MCNTQDLTDFLSIEDTHYLLAHLLHAVSFQHLGLVGTSVTQQIRRDDSIPEFGEVTDLMPPVVRGTRKAMKKQNIRLLVGWFIMDIAVRCAVWQSRRGAERRKCDFRHIILEIIGEKRYTYIIKKS